MCSSFCLVRTNPEGRVFYVAIFITTVLFHLLLCVCVMCRFSSRSGSKTTEHAPKNNERTRKNKRRIYEKKKKTANRGLDKQTTRKEDQIKTGSIKCCPFFSVSAIVSQCVCDWHPSFFVRPVRWHVLEADTPDAYTLAVPWCLTVIWARLLDEHEMNSTVANNVHQHRVCYSLFSYLLFVAILVDDYPIFRYLHRCRCPTMMTIDPDLIQSATSVSSYFWPAGRSSNVNIK